MKNTLLLLLFILPALVLFDCGDPSSSNSNDAAFPSLNILSPSTSVIHNDGGNVMTGTVNIYYIWYGDWTGNSAVGILEDLIKGFTNTSYFSINKTYYEVNHILVDSGADAEPMTKDVRVYVSGGVQFVTSLQVGYSRGKTLVPGDVEGIVNDVISSGALPADPQGVYFILSSADVAQFVRGGGFCNDYCGWHQHQDVNGIDIKYAFVGNGDRCPSDCLIQPQLLEAGVSKSPNENWGADGMASVIAHELSESITDPDIDAWQDDDGNENADKCAWRFDPTYQTMNGSRANTRFGDRDYLVQQNWVNIDAGYCALQTDQNVIPASSGIKSNRSGPNGVWFPTVHAQ